MKKQKSLTFGLMAILILGIVFMSGCVREETLPTPGGTTGETVGLKSCAELNGDICEVGDECHGTWLDASDTFSCCSIGCESSVSEGDLLTIDPFEVNPENEELGDLT